MFIFYCIAATDDPTSIWEKTGSWGGRFLKRIQFSQMKHGYEIATGFKVARGEVAIHIQTSGTHMSAVRDSVENDLKVLLLFYTTVMLVIIYNLCDVNTHSWCLCVNMLSKRQYALLSLMYSGFTVKSLRL